MFLFHVLILGVVIVIVLVIIIIIIIIIVVVVVVVVVEPSAVRRPQGRGQPQPTIPPGTNRDQPRTPKNHRTPTRKRLAGDRP